MLYGHWASGIGHRGWYETKNPFSRVGADNSSPYNNGQTIKHKFEKNLTSLASEVILWRKQILKAARFWRAEATANFRYQINPLQNPLPNFLLPDIR